MQTTEPSSKYFEENQIRELERIHSMSSEDVEARALALIHEDDEVQLVRGAFLAEIRTAIEVWLVCHRRGEIVQDRLEDSSGGDEAIQHN